MMHIERSPARDAAITTMLPHVAKHGWTASSLRAGLTDSGAPTDAAAWVFQSSGDMVEAYIDFADRRMAAATILVSETRLTRRVRDLIALRLSQAQWEREAVRRAAALMALPQNSGVAARSLARTVDAIWHAAGDRSTDFSWYTKRAILGVVYGTTLLHWLNQDGLDPDNLATLAFLDRRLASVGRIGRFRAKLTAARRPSAPGLAVKPL